MERDSDRDTPATQPRAAAASARYSDTPNTARCPWEEPLPERRRRDWKKYYVEVVRRF